MVDKSPPVQHHIKEEENQQQEEKAKLKDTTNSDRQINELMQKMYPLSDYKIMKEIGRGSYGTVASAFCLKTGKEVAIKRIPNAFQSKNNALRLWREVSILSQLPSHPCIVRLNEIIDPKNYPNNFKGLFLVFQKVSTDL